MILLGGFDISWPVLVRLLIITVEARKRRYDHHHDDWVNFQHQQAEAKYPHH
jgi:hypothetical protein